MFGPTTIPYNVSSEAMLYHTVWETLLTVDLECSEYNKPETILPYKMSSISDKQSAVERRNRQT
jgi:hypothetical protein